MISKPLKVLVDTNIFVSLYNKNDSNHQKAIKDYKKLPENANLYVTNEIISEVITIVSQRVSKKTAIAFINKLSKYPNLEIIFVNEDIFEKTLNLFPKIKSKNISFVDCTSFIVYKEFKLDSVFTYDKEFKKYGFITTTSPAP